MNEILDFESIIDKEAAKDCFLCCGTGFIQTNRSIGSSGGRKLI